MRLPGIPTVSQAPGNVKLCEVKVLCRSFPVFPVSQKVETTCLSNRMFCQPALDAHI